MDDVADNCNCAMAWQMSMSLARFQQSVWLKKWAMSDKPYPDAALRCRFCSDKAALASWYVFRYASCACAWHGTTASLPASRVWQLLLAASCHRMPFSSSLEGLTR